MPISDDDLLVLTDCHISDAVRFIDEEISDDRTKGLKYFRGDKLGNEVRGRSQVVSTDVRDAIEWTLPSLMRVFFQGEDPVIINGVTDDDAKQAKNAQRWVKHVLTRMNGGFMLYYTWFKDALMKKNGFVSAYWSTETKVYNEVFEGLTKPDYELLTADSTYEVQEVEEVTLPNSIRYSPDLPPLIAEITLYNVKAKHTIDENSLVLEGIEPEDLFVPEDTVSAKNSRFWLHRPRKTLSEIREVGYKVSDDVTEDVLPAENLSTTEIMEKHRHGYDPLRDAQGASDSTGIDPSMKKVYFYKMDIKVDLDDTGIAQWWRICRVGDEIVEKERILYPMYPSLTPYPNSHMLFGDSYADIIGAFQELKTSMHRIVLDYIYYSTNPRAELAMGTWSDEFTFDDWINNAPNSMVRVREKGTVTPIYPAPLQPQVLSLLEYWESQKEGRIGVTRYSAGLDGDSLNKTATGVTSIMQAASERIELVARIFAETGVKDLVKTILDLTVEYPEMSDPLISRLNDNEGEPLSAESVRGSFDFTITVGTGSGDRAQIMTGLLNVFQMYEKMIEWGAGPTAEKRLVSWRNLHNLVTEYIKMSGLQNTNDFTTDPEAPRRPDESPPPPPQKDAQTIATEQQGQYLQAELQHKDRELQFKAQEAQLKNELEIAKLRLQQHVKDRELDIKEADVLVEARDKGVRAGGQISTSGQS